MKVLISGAALNVLLDPLFIYRLHWGISGAAIATAVSQLFSTLLYLGYIRSKKAYITFACGSAGFLGKSSLKF